MNRGGIADGPQDDGTAGRWAVDGWIHGSAENVTPLQGFGKFFGGLTQGVALGCYVGGFQPSNIQWGRNERGWAEGGRAPQQSNNPSVDPRPSPQSAVNQFGNSSAEGGGWNVVSAE
jgi:hypothetical protein